MSFRPPKVDLDVADEAALLRQARSASASEREAAHRRLFQLFRDPVTTLCIRLTGNESDAEDAIQESFVSVFRALAGFRGEARLSTWIHRIALREALRQKARRLARRTEPLEAEPAAPSSGNPAIQREQRDELVRALDRLGAEHRVVLALFAVDGLSHREIAHVLGVPEGTIWSRLHTARKRLAAELAPLR